MGALLRLPLRAAKRPREHPRLGVMGQSENLTGQSIPRLMKIARSMATLSRRHGPIPTRGRRSTSRTTSRFPPKLRRAKEQGRGRHAVAPWQIPWAGWKDIFWRVYASVNDNRLLAVAAGVVFYSLLAIFPAIAAFASLYGLIADASTIDSHLSLAAGIFPFGAVDILHEQIARLTAKGDAKLSLGFITGLTVALWSANAGMKGIIDALKVVNDEKEKRSFVKLNLLSHAW